MQSNRIINRAMIFMALFFLFNQFVWSQMASLEKRCLWIVRDSMYNKNAIDEQTIVMREFNKHIKHDSRVEKVILPLGDGLTICRKI